MQYFPLNTPLTSVPNAVSASLATSASFIANFASIPVTTASVALNITGSRGTDGTSVLVVGPKGETGDRGDRGFRGNSIFLLSSSWSGSACTPASPCYEVQLNLVETTGPSQYTCYSDTFTILYSDTLVPSLGANFYYDSTCTTTPAVGPIGARNNQVIITDVNGEYVSNGICSSGVVCSGQCVDGVGCSEGCFCSTPSGIGTCTSGNEV